MSKKLIAVASAAALALSALVGIAPATAVGAFDVAAPAGTAEATATNDGTTALKADTIQVPSADVLRFNAGTTNSTGTLVRYDVTTPAAAAAVTVTSTGGVEVLSATQFDDVATATTATGTTALSISSDSTGAVSFYAYTTSTSAGTVVVSSAGSSKTMYLKGLSTFPYNLSFSASSTAALGGDIVVSGTVKDAFGNNLTTALSTTVSTDWVLGNVGATAPTTLEYSSTTKVYTFTFTAPATAQATAVQIGLNAAKKSTKVTAFGTPVLTQFFSVNTVDLSAQVTALTAQVAALTADYNALAAKWNKRVASKTAPKKAVATK